MSDDHPVTQHWPRRCKVCEAAIDQAAWSKLQKLGYVGAFRAHGQLYAVELRDCECGSTLGLEVALDVQPAAVA